MFLTSDPKLFDKVLTLSNHGRTRGQKRQFWADVAGFKFKMSNLQAALGCAQLKRIDELTNRKREILKNYKILLQDIDDLAFNKEDEGCVIGAWMPTIVFPSKSKITRDFLISKFSENKIDARVFFWPLSSLPIFSENLLNRNAYDISSRAFNLPSYHDITKEEQQYVSEIILNFWRKNALKSYDTT
jgi:perosamine synthetase